MAFKNLSREGQELVNNQTLMNKLKWDSDRYQRIKKQLEEQGLIKRKQGGPGGAVALAATKAEALTLFVSYSHIDEVVTKELEKHLYPLERKNLIKKWSDRQIIPGQEWDKVISDKLKTARIFVIMVSVDFLNSTYCYDIEMDAALDYRQKGNLEIIPVVVRPCLWKNNTPFGGIQALPKDGLPICTWPSQDEALVNVAEGIEKAAEKLLKPVRSVS